MRRVVLALLLALCALVPLVASGTAQAACVQTPCGSIAATMNWGSIPLPGTTGYDEYVNGVQVASSTAATFTFTGLACGTTYNLGVRAHNGVGGTSPTYTQSYATEGCTTGAAGATIFPLKVSSNGRYLETNGGNPFLMVGDSPQDIIGNLTVTNAEAYYDDRAREGFNTVWDNLLCTDYTACATSGVAQGDGSGTIPPFTVGTAPASYAVGPQSTAPYCGDCNTAYFTRAHTIIAHAMADGIEVFLDPAETGGWSSFINANGDGTLSTTDGDYRYGEYLGNEFKDLPNITWLMGNDFRNISTNPDMNNAKSLEAGIKATDPTALFTVEGFFLSYLSTSTSLIDTNGFDTTWENYTNLDGAYTYATGFMGINQAYGEQSTRPAYIQESNYEGQKDGNYDGCQAVKNCRLNEWWAMTSGATGQLYGGNYQSAYGTANDGSYGLLNGFTNANIDTTGATQLGYQTAFFNAIPWQNLVPDTSHNVITAGTGTCPTYAQQVANNSTVTHITSVNCVTTSSDYSGAGTATESVSYLPGPSGLQTITANLASFINGTLTAKWYDPTNGHYQTATGSGATTGSGAGTQTFTPPSANSSGDDDWVLLLQANPSGGFAVSCSLTFAAGSTGSNSTTPIANDGSSGTCWGQQTGVYAGTGDTEAAIEANPSGLGFTVNNGDLTINTSGTTINHYWVKNGCINIASGVNNVTIENTLVTDSVPDCTLNNEAGAGIHAGGNPPTSSGTLVKDVTIDGAPTGDSNSDTSGIIMDNGTVEQTNVFGFTKGLVSDANSQSTPTLYQDNYVHDFEDCSHDDGTWEDGFGGVNFEHNYIYTNDPANNGCATGACVGGSDVGTSGGNVEHDVTYNENFCSGFDGEDGQTGCGGYDITITNNVMDNTAAKFDAWGGFNSPDFQDSWSGNTQINHSGTSSTAPDPSSGICSGAPTPGTPTISGTATHGDTLTVNPGSWTSSPTFAYQWFDCDTSGANCVPISGATNSTYPLTTSDEGHTVRALVIGTDSSSPNQSIKATSQTATVN